MPTAKWKFVLDSFADNAPISKIDRLSHTHAAPRPIYNSVWCDTQLLQSSNLKENDRSETSYLAFFNRVNHKKLPETKKHHPSSADTSVENSFRARLPGLCPVSTLIEYVTPTYSERASPTSSAPNPQLGVQTNDSIPCDPPNN